MTQPYAEEVNYWQTGKTPPDGWIAKCRKEIEEVGGIWLSYLFAEQGDQSAFRIEFSLEDQRFRMVWPVLESETGKTLAAQRQAATALYHLIKAKCVEVKFLGAQRAFHANLVLEDGRTAGDLLPGEIKGLPKLIESR